jgi:hypothetical protein
MKKFGIAIVLALVLSGCGVKDPSFYDLKSPCVSVGSDVSENDPCIRTSPMLNEFYQDQVSLIS